MTKIQGRFSPSLSLRLALYIFLVSFLLTLCSSVLQLLQQYRNQITTVESDLDYIENSYREFITRSLYNYDTSQLELEMKGMLQIPSIVYVEVIDYSLSENNRFTVIKNSDSRDRILESELYYQQGDDTILIGKMTVAASLAPLKKSLRRQGWILLLSNTLIIFLVAFLTIFLVSRLITRNLAHMAQFAQQMDMESLEERLILPRKARRNRDELDYVVQAINDLLSRIRIDMEQRKAMEQDLERINQDLKEMVYIASHDLQVPIVSIEGYASELMEDYRDKLDDEGLYCISRLKDNAVRMHTLVLSLLDISRLNTREYDHEWIRPYRLVQKITEDLKITLEKAGARIELDDIPWIFGDRLRIEDVFRNLITNAIKYQGKTITIGYNTQKGISIRDDGIGIPPDQVEKIFDPGERLKQIRTEGVGMGLTFCRKVMSIHEGTIKAESRGEGAGSTFFLQFPPNRIREVSQQ